MEHLNKEELSYVWRAVDEILRQRFSGSNTSYELWFGRMTLSYLDAESAVFACENKAKCSIISQNYLPILTDCLHEAIGYMPVVSVEVDPTLAPEVAPTVSAEDSPLELVRKRKKERGEGDGPRSGSRPGGKVPTGNEKEKDKDEEKPPAPPKVSDPATDADPSPDSAERRLSYNDDYTFENFIVGNSNHLAHAAALSVADSVGMKINPLFIWGPSGLGKTHLMYAIANRALRRDPNMKVIYVKGEEFMNQMIEAIRQDRNIQFRQKYRKADMLLIDDIQFIAGKESTQTEFFHTFDALYEDRRQIILTSDRPPKELTALEERIRSRFEAGLLVDIQPPDYELRMAILQDKINQNHLDVPENVIDFLAQNLQENIRQLEGVVKKLAMTSLLTGKPVDMEMVLTAVPEYLHNAEPVSDTVTRIIATVAARYSVSVKDVLGQERKKNIQTARNVSMYLVRMLTPLSLPQIGQVFHRDHSTVHSNIGNVETALQSDPIFEALVEDIKKEIKRG